MDPNTPPPDDAQLPVLLSELTVRAVHGDLEVRRLAIEQIYEIAYKVGSKATVAIPVLVGGLVDPDPKIGESSLWALKYCAPDSIEPLIECLAHQVAFARERAAHSLGNIGDEARAAAPNLRELLSDRDQAVRRRAAWALGLIHDSEPDTLALLARMITDGTTEDRGAALHALGNIGKAADTPRLLAPYRPQILAALDSPDARVRRWALYAAESVGLTVQALADLMASMLRRDESGEVRSAALSALKNLAPSVDLATSVPSLTSQLVRPGREAALACEVLASMRPAPTLAIPFLQEALSHDELVLPAAAALWHIEGNAETILPAMKRIFNDNGEGVCDLICKLGSAASPLIPDLIEALAGENWDLQWAAADALGAIASSDGVVLTPLIDALSHPSPIVRSASARALARTGVVAVSVLRALLADASDPRAAWAAYALGEIGPIAAEALPELRAGMRDGEEPIASCCAIAVALIAADVESVPYLVAVLRSEDSNTPRRSAALALAELGPAAFDAVGTLEALVDDEDPNVAEAAMKAVSAILGVSH